jgi:hypothetical protein
MWTSISARQKPSQSMKSARIARQCWRWCSSWKRRRKATRASSPQVIQPIKVRECARIDDLIAQLQQDWLAGPAGWLARAIGGRDDESRFAVMAAEDWRE